ncbi:MAG: translesion error-prone DNA polymerase V autoproteolytic subunit [Verrucomicrobia bacterium]|nr:translesion error-prone DNA polymerase V autoproteolytic subunit [Verrucomicrobiota bacterium]
MLLGEKAPCPLFDCQIQAGFPSPADDEVGDSLNLQEMLVPHPNATFYVKVVGDSMTGAGIFSGDILIVDRSVKVADRAIVVAIVNKEFTVKRLVYEGSIPTLVPENPQYPILRLQGDEELEIWGVVTYVLHKP